METSKTSARADKVLELILSTRQNVFVTGKAGTGKTTLLKKILDTTYKNAAVVAPTGIAALNAGGVTIHSFFQIAPSAYVPDPYFRPSPGMTFQIESLHQLNRVFKLSGARRDVIRSLELLIIDEVSMVRADLLDAMDFVLKKIRKNQSLFGGVQVVFFGDLYQLPPVVKPEEWDVLQRYYPGLFFFQAKCLAHNPPLYTELKTIYRQSDETFINLLNHLRENKCTDEDKTLLNKYVNPSFELLDHPGYIYLTTHNHKADAINTGAMSKLNTPVFRYTAEITGEFPEKIYPMPETLVLKEGAQVMFTKNDISGEKRYFNGKIGKISRLTETEICVFCADDQSTIEVEKYEWFHKKYELNESTKEIDEKVLGSFVHFPLKLAWAITVHKSQGLTFDKAMLDVADVFQPGQAYVALSRLRSLEGLVLKNRFDVPDLAASTDIIDLSVTEPDDQRLQQAIETGAGLYILELVKKAFDLHPCREAWEATARFLEEENHADIWTLGKETLATTGEILDKAMVTARSFMYWLDDFFRGQKMDQQLLLQKVSGARKYFFDILDPLEQKVWFTISACSQAKRTKTIVNQFFALEDAWVTCILHMYKAEKLVTAWIAGTAMDKNVYRDFFYQNYRNEKMEAARAKTGIQTKTNSGKWVVPSGKKAAKKEKTEKIPTHEVTYALWQQKKSLPEIAAERTLTLNTIESHFARLIDMGKVQLEDVLSSAKIRFFDEKMKGYTGPDNLTDLKNYLGDVVSYGEIRLWKAGRKEMNKM